MGHSRLTRAPSKAEILSRNCRLGAAGNRRQTPSPSMLSTKLQRAFGAVSFDVQGLHAGLADEDGTDCARFRESGWIATFSKPRFLFES